jgi:hypothetical protein
MRLIKCNWVYFYIEVNAPNSLFAKPAGSHKGYKSLARWSKTCQHLYPTICPRECARAVTQHIRPLKYIFKNKKINKILVKSLFYLKNKSEREFDTVTVGNSKFVKRDI